MNQYLQSSIWRDLSNQYFYDLSKFTIRGNSLETSNCRKNVGKTFKDITIFNMGARLETKNTKWNSQMDT